MSHHRVPWSHKRGSFGLEKCDLAKMCCTIEGIVLTRLDFTWHHKREKHAVRKPMSTLERKHKLFSQKYTQKEREEASTYPRYTAQACLQKERE
jgi:hypothetical protein